MFPRYRDTRRMDHVRLYSSRLEPARQPEAVATGFEGNCNPRDIAASLDCLVAPAMQHSKQPFWARLQLLARMTLNAGKDTANQPARLAHLDDGNDRAILVQGGPAPRGLDFPCVQVMTTAGSPARPRIGPLCNRLLDITAAAHPR